MPQINVTEPIPMASVAVFSPAALAGLALGSFGLGTLSDRIGRKKVLIGAMLYGACTIARALAGSLDAAVQIRFLPESLS